MNHINTTVLKCSARIAQWRSQEFLSIGQLKSQPGYNFSKLLIFLQVDVYEREKSTNFNQHMIVFGVLYYFTKVFFNFKVFYHLSCKNYQNNHIFLWSNAGGYLASKPRRCKKLFSIDVKGFPRQFFSSHIF
jgi:hypothetical protein